MARGSCLSGQTVAIALCGFSLLLVSGCGGGGGGDDTNQPFTAQILYSFGDKSNDALGPDGALVQDKDGNFYGISSTGGTGGGHDGDHPAAGVIQANDGNFYGTAINYFENSDGMVFELTPEGNLTRLHSFASGPTDGAFPQGSLLLGSDGNVYGTTADGGLNNFGTVFKVTPDGVETVLHNFGGSPADGAAPNYGVVQGADGNLYGTTSNGGTKGYGTVFKLTPDGVETVLYSFSGTGDGAYPSTALVQGSNGNFYGGTYSGGVSTAGATIFELTSAGVVTSLYSFPSAANSVTNLVNGSDGNLYGTTYQGGTHESGMFFRFRLN